jgi:hypothetical protein
MRASLVAGWQRPHGAILDPLFSGMSRENLRTWEPMTTVSKVPPAAAQVNGWSPTEQAAVAATLIDVACADRRADLEKDRQRTWHLPSSAVNAPADAQPSYGTHTIG